MDQFTFTLPDILVILGFGNALVLFLSLRSLPEGQRRAARFLGLFVLLYTLEIMNWSVIPAATRKLPFVLPFMPVLFFMAVLVYFFLRSIEEPEFKYRKFELWLWVPGIVDVVYHCFTWFYVIRWPGTPLSDFFTGRTAYLWRDGLAILFSLGVWVLIWRQIRNMARAGRPHFPFYRAYLLILTFMFSRWVLFSILGLWFPGIISTTFYYVIWMAEMFLLLYLGYRGLLYPSVFAKPKVGFSVPTTEVLNREGTQLRELLEEKKLYLDPELNRQVLAEAMGKTEVYISNLIKLGLNTSFYQLVNGYRVQEAIRLIEAGWGHQYTFEHIAKSAGFRSKTTFTKAFKQTTGKTPKNYHLAHFQDT